MSTDPISPPAPASSSNTRFVVLLVLLGIMLGALWYDRYVARPAVEDAYARIAKLNSDINSQAGKAYMTDKDVQNELKRKPIDQFTTGNYMVEVYGWRAGLPMKSHKYYAVYEDGTPYVFLKHYMNVLDMDELKSLPQIVVGADASTDAVQEIVLPGGSPLTASAGEKESSEPSSESQPEKGSESGEQKGDPNSPSQDAPESAKSPDTGS